MAGTAGEPEKHNVPGPKAAKQPPRDTAIQNVQAAKHGRRQEDGMQKHDPAGRQTAPPEAGRNPPAERDRRPDVQAEASLAHGQRHTVDQEAMLLAAEVRIR